MANITATITPPPVNVVALTVDPAVPNVVALTVTPTPPNIVSVTIGDNESTYDHTAVTDFPFAGALKTVKFGVTTGISNLVFEQPSGSSGVVRAIQFNFAKTTIDENIFVNSPEDALIKIHYDGETSPSVSVPVLALCGAHFGGDYSDNESTGIIVGEVDSRYAKFAGVTKDGNKNVVATTYLKYPIPYTNGIKITVTAPAGYQASFNVEYQDYLPQSCWNRDYKFRTQYLDTTSKSAYVPVASVAAGWSNFAVVTTSHNHGLVNEDVVYFTGDVAAIYPDLYIVSVSPTTAMLFTYPVAGSQGVPYVSSATGILKKRISYGNVTVTDGSKILVGDTDTDFTGSEGMGIIVGTSSVKELFISRVVDAHTIEVLDSDLADTGIFPGSGTYAFTLFNSTEFTDIAGAGYLVSVAGFFAQTDCTPWGSVQKSYLWVESAPRFFVDNATQPQFVYSDIGDFFQIAIFTQSPYANYDSGLVFHEPTEKYVAAYRNFPMPLQFTERLQCLWPNTMNCNMDLRWVAVYYATD